MKEQIYKELTSLAKDDYRIFSAKLLPNINNILGVRLPLLRKIAKRLVKSDYDRYLLIYDLSFFEEVMLQGMIIGYLKLSWDERLPYIKNFVSKINNWSVCDSFCRGLKVNPDEKEAVWKSLMPYFDSDSTYDIRFAVVMSLFYFVDDKYAQSAFKQFDRIKQSDYYVRMAIAWAISIYFRDLPVTTMSYLKKNQIDDWTYNKALQKITELRRVDNETKQMIRLMKRKRSSR